MSVSPGEESRAPRPRNHARWLALILLVAFGLRAAYLLELAQTPAFDNPLYDPQYNDYWARGLVTQDWTLPPGVNDPEIRTTPHGRPPGYPWFLAAVYGVFGLSYWAPRLVQMALGLGSVLLGYALGRRLHSPGAGLVTALGFATYWALIYFEGEITYPAVAVFLLLALMLVLHAWLGRQTLGWAVLAGLLMGVFALFRPNGLLCAPVLLLWFGWVLWRGGRLRAWWRTAAAFAIALAVPLVPPLARNVLVADDFVFLSSYGGLNLYVGNHAGAPLVEPRIPGLEELAGIDNWSCFDYPAIVRGLGAQVDDPELSFSEANRIFYGRALEFVRMNPGEFLRNTVKKVFYFWSPVEITNDTMPALEKAHSAVLRWLPGFPWLAGLSWVGVAAWIATRRERTPGQRQFAAVLLLFATAYLVSVLPYFIAGRYRLPVIPFLLVFAALGLVHLGYHWRYSSLARALGWTSAAAAAVAVAHVNVMAYTPAPGVYHFRQGVMHARAGDVDGARQHYETALAARPDDPAIYHNLGRLLLQVGEEKTGLDVLHAGLAVAPDSAALHNTLGWWHFAHGRTREAIAQYRRAIEGRPRFAPAWINLGIALEANEAPVDALAAFEQAAAINPASADAHYNAGRMHEKLGDEGAAVARYREAIAAWPEHARAYNNLGLLLLAAGHGEEAARHFAEAVRHEETLGLAWVNLGNARLGLGDVRGAAEAYAQGMANDPKEATASYNLGQLAAKAGDLARARELYETALTRDPGFVAAAEALAALDTPL
jgi:tetratricopeptide (TPR) repeat protein